MKDREPRARRTGACDECHAPGTVEQAYDLRRWLCLDARRCLAKASAARKVGQTPLPSADGPES